jgi:hypothetical protein
MRWKFVNLAKIGKNSRTHTESKKQMKRKWRKITNGKMEKLLAFAVAGSTILWWSNKNMDKPSTTNNSKQLVFSAFFLYSRTTQTLTKLTFQQFLFIL